MFDHLVEDVDGAVDFDTIFCCQFSQVSIACEENIAVFSSILPYAEIGYPEIASSSSTIDKVNQSKHLIRCEGLDCKATCLHKGSYLGLLFRNRHFGNDNVGGMNLHGQKEEMLQYTCFYQVDEDICVADYNDFH